jgi:putative PIN family toxin of toxin-antitoxin system
MLTVVPDATVLVSAAISHLGNPDRILAAWQDGRLGLVVCPHLLSEVHDVLLRARMRRYLTESEADEFVELLTSSADVRTDPSEIAAVVLDDPKDDYLFALAREVGADFILSSDRHLTRLVSPYPPVITPALLVAHLEREALE